MNTAQNGITEWELFWEEGLEYARLCGLQVKHFTNEIRYNLAAMAIEKLSMGFLMRQHSLPDGHTLRDLMDALEAKTALPEALSSDIRQMDNFQQICAFDTYTRTVPNDEEMADIVKLVEALKLHLSGVLS